MIEHVPTLPELAREGLAEVVESSKVGTFYRATPEGQQRLDEVMRRNGAWLAEHPEVSTERAHQAIRAARAAGGTKK